MAKLIVFVSLHGMMVGQSEQTLVMKMGVWEAQVTRKPNDYGEYVAKFYRAGKHVKNADYFTDDYDDCVSTARTQLQTLNS